ncbi:hypothetical protein [Streptomyces sp. NPDC127098]|uniref:hypothetical protein n=1 Tax=Streptomyces sp. NPDC127098 TaxID=3347137 RepID=UPI003668C8B3
MPPKCPNPPLDRIRPEHIVTPQQAAAQFGVTPGAIMLWAHRNKVEHLPLPGRRVYHLPTLTLAERDAWKHGANRSARGGRPPGWKPCTTAA